MTDDIRVGRDGIGTFDDLRILKVQDDSMEPEIHEGDRVVFDLSNRLPAAGGTFALRDGDGLVVRRVALEFQRQGGRAHAQRRRIDGRDGR